MRTKYRPVDNGYEITGSHEVFNRALYGGHDQDDLSERFVTFAGDQPVANQVIMSLPGAAVRQAVT